MNRLSASSYTRVTNFPKMYSFYRATLWSACNSDQSLNCNNTNLLRGNETSAWPCNRRKERIW